MQRAKCGGGGSFARELEVIFQDTLQTPVSKGGVKEREGLPLRNVDQLAAGNSDWKQKPV